MISAIWLIPALMVGVIIGVFLMGLLACSRDERR